MDWHFYIRTKLVRDTNINFTGFKRRVTPRNTFCRYLLSAVHSRTHGSLSSARVMSDRFNLTGHVQVRWPTRSWIPDLRQRAEIGSLQKRERRSVYFIVILPCYICLIISDSSWLRNKKCRFNLYTIAAMIEMLVAHEKKKKKNIVTL